MWTKNQLLLLLCLKVCQSIFIPEAKSEKHEELEIPINNPNEYLQYLVKDQFREMMTEMRSLKENLQTEVTKTVLSLSEDMRKMVMLVMMTKAEQTEKNKHILQEISDTKLNLNTIRDEIKEEICCSKKNETNDLRKKLDDMENTLDQVVGTSLNQAESLNKLTNRIEALSYNINRIENNIEDMKKATVASTTPLIPKHAICSKSGPELRRMMKVGTRVVRGKDFAWGDQDGNPPGQGTVVSEYSSNGPHCILVEWDHNKSIQYHYCMGEKYDLTLALCQNY